MALTIKDGNSVTTSLKTTLTGSEHMPHHIVQAVSGTVNVTSSLTNPVIAQLGNITTTGIPGAGTALVVSLSGSTGSFNQVQLYDSYVGINNVGFQQLVNYLTSTIDTGDSDYRIKVITTGSSAVTVNNNAADAAFMALSSSFAGNELKVKLTGSNTIKEGAYDILLVRGTGSTTTIENEGFGQAINYITAAVDLGDSEVKFKVKLTGSSTVTIDNQQADHAFIALSSSQTNEGLRVKLSGSNTISEGGYDIVRVRTTGSSISIDNNGFQQAINYITSAYNSSEDVGKFNVHLTGNSTVTVDNQYFNDAVVALSYSFAPVDGGAFKVKLTGSNTVQLNSYDVVLAQITGSAVNVTNSSGDPLFITSSYDLVVKEKPAKASTVNGFYYPGQIDWTNIASGTFELAEEDENRKGLIISNPSEHNLYISVGSGSYNGFTLTSTASSPVFFSFVIYPFGTYIAEPVIAGTFHGGFFVSSSSDLGFPYAMSTKVSY
jgi:hypothetical protein